MIAHTHSRALIYAYHTVPAGNHAIKRATKKNDCTLMISVCIHVLPCVNASSHAQTYPVHVLETGGQSSLTRLNTVYRKTCLKESLEAEKQTLGQMDSSHGNECSLERGTSKTISRKGKLRSSKRWLTPPKDSGAIKRHLHWGISVWTLVWEESSVCARITGIQLLRALVRSFQLSGLHVSWAFSELLHRWCSGVQQHLFLLLFVN